MTKNRQYFFVLKDAQRSEIYEKTYFTIFANYISGEIVNFVLKIFKKFTKINDQK